jgi:hypothetical protein
MTEIGAFALSRLIPQSKQATLSLGALNEPQLHHIRWEISQAFMLKIRQIHAADGLALLGARFIAHG